ncbi:MAG: STAS domain-containing protein [Chloroflexi bacterium]|nr:STAS domain-containing protein [Chloroflexota bacterium]
MPTKINTKQYNRVDLVEVTGRVDSSTAPLLDQALQKIIKEDRAHIVVDLSQTEYVSSAGLRALLAAQKATRNKLPRGDVRLAGMSDKVKKAFELAGFLELFPLYDNATDAVGSF